jgi:hypothetical protein
MISQKTRASLTITVGTLLVTFGTLLLVAIASGYRIDFFKGEISATGLALLNTSPSGSSIKINSQKISPKTPYRLENVNTGPLRVQYSKPNYLDWQADFFVRAGQVTFADYALLIPTQINPKIIADPIIFSSVASASKSSKMFATVDSPSNIYEITSSDNFRKVVEFPINSSIKPPNKLSKPTISPDGNSLLTRASYEDGTATTFWLNTNSGELRDIDKIFGPNTTNLNINPKNSKEVFGLGSSQVKKLNAENSNSITLPMSSVLSYQIDDDYIFTLEGLSPATSGQFLVRYDHNGNNRYVLYQYPPTAVPWNIIASKLSGEVELALHDPSTGGLHIFSKVNGKYLSSFIGLGNSLPSFSPTGRFISFITESKLRTIDIEYTDRFYTQLEAAQELRWLTDYQIIVTTPSGLEIVDYNGFNKTKIPPSATPDAGYSTALKADTKSIYFIASGKINYYSLQPKSGLIDFR